jgi:hypothetical protein
MYRDTTDRESIHKFLQCKEWRVDELFACGAIVEMPDGIYSKAAVAEAFNEESYIKGEKKRPRPPVRWNRPETVRSVYFVEDGDAIKIGIGLLPEVRVNSLQVGNPRMLTLLGHFKPRCAAADERDLHNRFKAHWIRGEWFRDNPELRELIAAKCPSNDNTPIVPESEVA